MRVDAAMAEYYRQRAPCYERVYHKPERQEDLRKLRQMVVTTFAGKDVLDVACGTGYWTEIIADAANSIVGIDFNEEVLDVARGKPMPKHKVRFLRGDAYVLPDLGETFDAGMVGFWWSHVPKAKLRDFLTGLHSKLKPGASVMVFDNALESPAASLSDRK